MQLWFCPAQMYIFLFPYWGHWVSPTFFVCHLPLTIPGALGLHAQHLQFRHCKTTSLHPFSPEVFIFGKLLTKPGTRKTSTQGDAAFPLEVIHTLKALFYPGSSCPVLTFQEAWENIVHFTLWKTFSQQVLFSCLFWMTFSWSQVNPYPFKGALLKHINIFRVLAANFPVAFLQA